MLAEAGLSLYSVLLLFIIYSFIGWCIEVVYYTLTTGHFVNRGFLNGPLCPIYGFGALFVIVLLTPVSHNVLLLFAASVLITTTLELLTGFVLQKAFHATWWDYSDEPFNFKGYICLKFSLLWGIACLLLMKVLHPGAEFVVHHIPPVLGWVIIAVFYSLFLVDLIVTVVEVRHLDRDLGELAKLAGHMHEGSDFVASHLGDAALDVSERVEALHLREKAEAVTTQVAEMATELRAGHGAEELGRIRQLLSEHGPVRRRIMRAFPDMKHLRYPEALRGMMAQAKGKKGNKAAEELEEGNE